MNRQIRWAALVGFAAAAHLVCAQPYPSRPVRLVVPYSPGGGTDILSRAVAAKMSERLGQQVVVDNRAGGGTIVGTDIVAKAAPDGYTMLMNSVAMVINPSLHPKLPFDVQRDFAPVMLVATLPNLLVVHPAVPARSVREFLDLARAKPGTINFGSSGAGGLGHLAGELLRATANIDIAHVPYRGGGPLAVDLIAGQVQMSFASLPSVLPFIKAARLRALGVPTARRSRALPDVPTFAEVGFTGFEASNWQGVHVPAKTAAAIITRLHGELKAALATPEVDRQLAQNGFDPVGSTPAELATMMRTEFAKWAKVVKDSGAKAE